MVDYASIELRIICWLIEKLVARHGHATIPYMDNMGVSPTGRTVYIDKEHPRRVGKHPALAAPYGRVKFPRDDGSVGRALGERLRERGYKLVLETNPTRGDDWFESRFIGREIKINYPNWPPLAFAERCTYPNCDCAVSFPEGHKPSDATECPREG